MHCREVSQCHAGLVRCADKLDPFDGFKERGNASSDGDRVLNEKILNMGRDRPG